MKGNKNNFLALKILTLIKHFFIKSIENALVCREPMFVQVQEGKSFRERENEMNWN